MAPDDVMDIFVLVIRDTLKKGPYLYKRRAKIIGPLALLMLNVEHTAKISLTMIADIVWEFVELDLILLPIILNGHFHLLVLDKRKK